jgi:hypothetical protein
MKTYLIKPGCSFRLNDAGDTLGGGELIELADDVARTHADKIELLSDENTAPAHAALAGTE